MAISRLRGQGAMDSLRTLSTHQHLLMLDSSKGYLFKKHLGKQAAQSAAQDGGEAKGTSRR